MKFMLLMALSLVQTYPVSASLTPGRSADQSTMSDYASVTDIQLSPAGSQSSRIITDNTEAFDQRLKMIESATQSIEMAYYIFSSDESSSYLIQALIRAAHRGVKIRVLVDYSMGYPQLDLFSALESATKGSLQFRFYNRPSANIVKDSVYMSTACKDSDNVPGREQKCADEKGRSDDVVSIDALSDSAARNFNSSSGMSGVFLSGLYAKNATAMKIAITQGAKFNPALYHAPNGQGLTDDEKTGLKELIDLYLDMKGGSPLAALKLQMATWTNGESVSKILGLLNMLLPTGVESFDAVKGRSKDRRKEDWDHFTDFLHHKLMIVDNQKVILGGRNVENSYHMETNPSGKYTFMDTDVYLEVNASSGEQIQNTFQRLWNYRTMVASLTDVWQHAPNDVMKVAEVCAAKAASTPDAQQTSMKQCLGQFLSSPERIGQERARRAQAALTRLSSEAQSFTVLRPAEIVRISPSFAIDPEAQLDYVENLPFDRGQKLKDSEEPRRLYGANPLHESREGKGLHGVVVQSLLGLCGKTGSKAPQTPKNVYLYQAYWLPPSNVLNALGFLAKTGEESVFTGTAGFDCSNVNVRIITNSIPTTDLNVINILARHQMHEFFRAIELAKKSPRGARAAQFEYYEYDASKMKAPLSMHSKAWVTPEVSIIGSANGDIRSYSMDTNNGLVIRNAPRFTKAYSAYLQSKIDQGQVMRVDRDWRDYEKYESDFSGKIGDKTFSGLTGLDVETFRLVDLMFFAAAQKGKAWPTDNRRNSVKELLLRMGQAIRKDSRTVLAANAFLGEDLQALLNIKGSPRDVKPAQARRARNDYDATIKAMERLDDRFMLF